MSHSQLSLVYIFPSNLAHPGITIKLFGQLEALRRRFNVRLAAFEYRRGMNFVGILAIYALFHLKSFWSSLVCRRVYCRYNPKFPLLNLWLGLISRFKPVYLEHNVMFDRELAFLKRFFELRLHRWTMSVLRHSRVIHLSVAHCIQDQLVLDGIPRSLTRYLPNGYRIPQIHPDLIDRKVVDRVRVLKEKGRRLGLFVGNGYAWHGLDLITEIMAPYSDIVLIVVGPYAVPKGAESRVRVLGTLSPDTLVSLMPYCDFGIGPFRWELVGMTDGAPLKTREYLCYGLPILVNYDDAAAEIDELKPYVFHYGQNHRTVDALLALKFDRENLAAVARKVLSWELLLLPVLD